ncbi:MAG: polymerase subunit beta [Flavipsychrobacter sp.]|jgi:predicted nucleotidyltransferase|nr:polymerase subunit beta [Flavipsychrobacter sp.]
MSQNEIYAAIKNTVLAYLPNARVLLFGSYARGDNNRHSDYDLLIITQKGFSQKEKNNWNTRIHHALVDAIHAPFDILMYNEDEINAKRELPGHIVRTAMREGVVL